MLLFVWKEKKGRYDYEKVNIKVVKKLDWNIINNNNNNKLNESTVISSLFVKILWHKDLI